MINHCQCQELSGAVSDPFLLAVGGAVSDLFSVAVGGAVSDPFSLAVGRSPLPSSLRHRDVLSLREYEREHASRRKGLGYRK